MAERLVGNVDSVAPAGYLIPTSRGDARWIADRTPYGKSAEAVDVAAQSDFLKKALGAHAQEQLMEDKSGEVDKFRLHVSEFDLEEHLKL